MCCFSKNRKVGYVDDSIFTILSLFIAISVVITIVSVLLKIKGKIDSDWLTVFLTNFCFIKMWCIFSIWITVDVF